MPAQAKAYAQSFLKLTEERLELAKHYGCTNGTGFLRSKPLPDEEFEALITEQYPEVTRMTLFSQFDRIVVFDTETTGIDFDRDEIIELGAVCLTAAGETDSMDALVRLSPGRVLPPFITQLTGITSAQLETGGQEKEAVSRCFCQLLEGERTLLVAYNAQFDLNFLYRLLRPFDLAGALRAPRFLDALTVYRDRRDFPHKLSDAIGAYGLGDTAVNSHRAVDDARATVALLRAMADERDDLSDYLDLFGVHPQYGRSGRPIGSVTYRSQPYQRSVPLYAQQ